MTAYTLSWCDTESNFDNGGWTHKWLPTLCAGVVLGPIWIMALEFKSGYLHFVLVSHWVYFWEWNWNSKVATYTLCWRRTGSKFDVRVLTEKKRLPTVCAGVALSLLLRTEVKFERDYLHCVLASHWVQFWHWNVNQKRLPTVCAGVALDPFLIMEFAFKVATHTLCWRRTASALTSNFKKHAATWCRTRSNLDVGSWMQKWRPTLCAGVALDLILMMEFEFKCSYLHFVLASRWV